MLGATLTDAEFIASFLEGRSASKDNISSEKDAHRLTLLTAETWVSSTCGAWQSHPIARLIPGADKTADVTGQIDEVLNWLVVRGVRIEMILKISLLRSKVFLVRPKR